MTIANLYPLPDIDGLIDHISESTVFSTADIFTGFHKIPYDPKTKQKDSTNAAKLTKKKP